MDLDIEPEGAIIGTIANLSMADLSVISEQGSTKSPAITHLRSVHHAIARMLVAGLKPFEISASLGISKVTIKLLENSPAFEELLSFYREKANTIAFDVEGKMQLMYADGLSRLHEMIVDSETIDPDFLRRATFDLADRVGFGPTKNVKVQSTHTALSREDLIAIKERVRMKELSYASEETSGPEGMEAGQGAESSEGSAGGSVVANLSSCDGPALRLPGEGESLRAEVGEGAGAETGEGPVG